MKTRIRYLKEWPPQPGGAYGRGEILTAGTNESVLSKVHQRRGKELTFGCSFGGKEHSYDFKADNEKIAEELEKVLKANIGKTLLQIEDIEIETSP